MENIEKKISEALQELIQEKNDVVDLENQMSELQGKISNTREEMNEFEDKESGFYLDLKKEEQETDKKFREIFAERESKRKKLERRLQDKKEEFVNEMKNEIKLIEKNRDVELVKSTNELKEEKAKIEKALKLNEITKEEYLKLPTEQQKEVKVAKERYLINKKRFGEIEEEIKLSTILEGKTPKEKYLELYNGIKNIEQNLNIDNIENFKTNNVEETKIIEEETEKNEAELDNEKESKEIEAEENTTNNVEETKGIEEENEPVVVVPESNEVNTVEYVNPIAENVEVNRSNNNEQEQKNDNSRKLDSICIIESKNEFTCRYDNGDEINGKITFANGIRKKVFKEYNIKNICKQVCCENNEFLDEGDFLMTALQTKLLSRKINPVVLYALDGNEKLIKDYVKNIYNKEKFSFEIFHDMSNVNILDKLKIKKITKAEEKCGAKILGKLFNKNYALNKANKEEPIGRKVKNSNAHKDFMKTIEYINKDREATGRKTIDINSKENQQENDFTR